MGSDCPNLKTTKMNKDQRDIASQYYNETKDNDFTGFKYITWLEKKLTESRKQGETLPIDNVSQRSELLYKQVNWLMVNTPLEVEKIADFREHFEK